MHDGLLRGGTVLFSMLAAAMAGPAHAASPVTLSPPTLSFGKQVLGTTSSALTATLKNNQSVALTITRVAVTGNFAQAGGNCPLSPAQLGKGLSCTIRITFTPAALGSQTGTLTVTDNATNSPQSISLAGNGVAAVTVSPAKLNFGSVTIGIASSPKTVTLTNQQSVTLNLNNVFASGDYVLTSSTCGSGIPAMTSCTVGVTFLPKAAGTRNGTLSFSDDAPNTPQTVSLTGTGVAPVLVSIAVTPANPILFVNTPLQLTATGTYNNNTTKDISTSVTWTSDPPGVVSINTSGLATGLATGSTTATAALSGISGSTLLTVNQVFFPAGTMNTARYYHTATLMNTGTVLMAGGIGPVPAGTGALGQLASSELYNPATGVFTTTTSLFTARSEHSATLLRNGTVLIAGGVGSSGELSSAEVYNPTAAQYYHANNMSTARYEHTATLLPSGAVLVAGGYGGTGTLASAELYNPTTGAFTPIANSLNAARFGAAAILLPNGQVLIVGGADADGALASAELYDPSAGAFTLTTGSLNVARSGATATMLNSGQILIANGYNYATTGPLTSAELYDPASQTFTLTGSEASTKWLGTATLLTNGLVLMAGSALNSAAAELYGPASGTFSLSGALITPRDLETATLLADGTVLIAGGHSSSTNTVLDAAETFQPNVLTPPGLVSIAVTPANPSLAVAGSVQLVATGTFSDNSTQVLASVTWTSSNPAAATVSNDITNSGIAYAVAAGSTNITACAGSLCGNTPLTVTAH